MSNSKFLFAMAAAVVCTGLASCSDSEVSKVVPPGVDCGDVLCVDGHCVDGTCDLTCEDAPEKCGVEPSRCDDLKICHSDPECNGVGKCKAYKCGDDNTCKWEVCKGHENCGSDKGKCDPNKLEADGDWDGDGISNSIELQSNGLLDPCKADTDGDGVPDNQEDLNGDGIFQEQAGETDPSNPNSVPDDAKVALVGAVCNSKDVLGGSTEKLESLNVAAPKAIGTNEVIAPLVQKKGDVPIAVNYDDPAGLAIMFASKSLGLSAKNIFKNMAESDVLNSYVEAASFTSNIPLASWKTEGTYNPDLQVVPDHEVTRYTYNVVLNEGKTLEEFRDLLSNTISKADTTVQSEGKTVCNKGQVLLMLTKAGYYDEAADMSLYIYSGAASCADNPGVSARMADIASGTLASPKKLGSSINGYTAYEDFVCQTQNFGDSSSKVDFIWVIDNSGSMADELTNLAATVDEFMKRLKNAAIDYRIGVSGTDAYLLDEWNIAYDTGSDSSDNPYSPFLPVTDDNGNMLDVSLYARQNPYYGYTGIRPMGASTNREVLGQCLVGDKASEKFFANTVTENMGCKTDQKNLCGRGYEDGLKSGLTVLQRLKLDASGPVADYADDKEKTRKSNWAFNRKSEAEIDAKCPGGAADENAPEACAKLYGSCAPRDDALQYIIWVTDEESRQFKEQAVMDPNMTIDSFDADAVLEANRDSVLSPQGNHLVGCLTGYKLNNKTDEANLGTLELSKLVYEMKSGSWLDDYSYKDCNPPLKQRLQMLVKENKLREDSSLAEIREIFPEYYDMLMYYIKAYRENASKAGVAGFALVGDLGKEAGGNCDPLGDKPSDVTGADYGLSYIHMAKYLSTFTDDGQTNGKGGGYASICNTSYKNTVDEIFNDVAGRLSRHVLNGYPIASTISVALYRTNSETAEVLERGKDWSYDASQNAIIFTNVQNVKSDDKVAISYVIWRKVEG